MRERAQRGEMAQIKEEKRAADDDQGQREAQQVGARLCAKRRVGQRGKWRYQNGDYTNAQQQCCGNQQCPLHS